MSSGSQVETGHKTPRKPDRTRPLKTYSKKATSIGSTEPPPKRRHSGEVTQTPRPKKSESPSLQQDNRSQPSLPPPHASRDPKRGTIMSYFKVVSPSSNHMSSYSEPSSCGVEPASTPPSPPPLKTDSRHKKRRRLTTKVVSKDLDATGDAEEETTGRLDPETGQSTTTRGGNSGVLADTSKGALNKAATQQEQRLEAGKRGRGKGPNSKPVIVQTTLSLSMSDKGFAECKACNMIYNPYHEKDAKFHARRHAVMLKSKSQKGSEIP
ncbi:hypothetical protein DL766_008051 [Monosporascus sp. MC13-8B]|uniref:N-acetyltransferase ESCO zinc-finger domain-containing protein n=1 Tax=Monosporascus cannonballus TaxID=155416 RepID=A0ABY0GZH0_9PEZI|nr:hypothetical protein DL762_007490 [Monosporascus cannonballus]RYO82747.1 hypothetical protein DL763_008136 [Monosporascus cannonballus]RYP20998.1 hypothetical protein DL766_008051 [Monosporascus sp. MC13-8B]